MNEAKTPTHLQTRTRFRLDRFRSRRMDQIVAIRIQYGQRIDAPEQFVDDQLNRVCEILDGESIVQVRHVNKHRSSSIDEQRLIVDELAEEPASIIRRLHRDASAPLHTSTDGIDRQQRREIFRHVVLNTSALVRHGAVVVTMAVVHVASVPFDLNLRRASRDTEMND